MYLSVLIILCLTTFLKCQPSYQNSTTYDTIKSYYNDQQFGKIFDLSHVQKNSSTSSKKTVYKPVSEETYYSEGEEGYYSGGEERYNSQSEEIYNSEGEEVYYSESEEHQESYEDRRQTYVQRLTQLYDQEGPIIYEDILINIHKSSQSNVNYQQWNQKQVVFNTSLSVSNLVWIMKQVSGVGSLYSIVFSQVIATLILNLTTQNVSLAINLDGKSIININENQLQINGGLYYIPIALEFARQVDAKLINPNLRIDKQEIKMFHIPYFDSSLFEFLYDSSKHLISLQNIAIGMIQYQSQGLAEYLQTLLGLSNIDKMSSRMGLQKNYQVYEASFVLAFSNFQTLKPKNYATSIYLMSPRILQKLQSSVHNSLMARNKRSWRILKNANQDLQTSRIQFAMNKFTPKANMTDFITLFNKINDGITVSAQIVDLIYELLNPFKQRSVYETKKFNQNAKFTSQDTDSIKMVGSSQLRVAINGTSQINYAILVKKSLDDQFNGLDQSSISDLLNRLLLTNPLFCKDYASRLHLQNKK